ncbi:16S rRNA (cytidine(1402)-2'-O)-methyltransferase [Rubrivirga sp. IMCC43871]|uniref:16S rRNA (cytidine(1402)-2'-O)-methyltransferase n=1 Tax=Rubrivirga sp. IMCC43871 TaxID=3391575 RepID=UPI00398FE937
MLILVPTPVGNLEDITLRAIRTLKEADVVACEDTRTTGKLFNHFGIDTPRLSFHTHNEHGRVSQLVSRMQAGETVALVSDAGTPGISDPGFLLVRAAAEADIRVEALPGPTAFVPALVASGLPSDRFVFEGFLPHKKGRQTRIKALADEPRTSILYESPHRLVKLLGQLAEFLGEDRPAAVGRELTKIHEEVRRGTLAELAAHYGAQAKVRGEIVVVVGGAEGTPVVKEKRMGGRKERKTD